MTITTKQTECCLLFWFFFFSYNTSTLTHFWYYAIMTMLEKDMFPYSVVFTRHTATGHNLEPKMWPASARNPTLAQDPYFQRRTAKSSWRVGSVNFSGFYQNIILSHFKLSCPDFSDPSPWMDRGHTHPCYTDAKLIAQSWFPECKSRWFHKNLTTT